MSEQVKISAAIITYNEEDNIADCILNLQKVCSEIVLVDSLSEDKTVAIAKELGAKVVDQAYLGDGPQKQLATNSTSNNWVLSIDADERLDDDALKMIPTLDFSDPRIAYSFRRKNFVGKKWLKVSDFYPDRKTRLYNKEHSNFIDRRGHSYVDSSNIVELDADILHYAYVDIAHWIKKYNFLSSRDAWVKKDKEVSGFMIIVHAFWTFFRNYFFRGGWYQGMDGLTVSLFTAFFNYVKYIKVKEMKDKSAEEVEAFSPKGLR